MKGYKTVTVNVVGLIVAVGSYWGFDVDPEVVVALVGVLLPIVNVALRSVTSTKIFEGQ